MRENLNKFLNIALLEQTVIVIQDLTEEKESSVYSIIPLNFNSYELASELDNFTAYKPIQAISAVKKMGFSVRCHLRLILIFPAIFANK